MSDYKCQVCYLSFKLNKDKLPETSHCDSCNRNVCDKCITEEKNKCNICAHIPFTVRDLDYDCRCELCGYYDGDGFCLTKDEHGLDRYICSCCKNGCANNEDEECRCCDILLNRDDDYDDDDGDYE